MESSFHPARILFELNPGEPMQDGYAPLTVGNRDGHPMGAPTRGRVATGIREHQGEHELTQGSHQGRIAVTRVDAKGLAAGEATLLS